MSPVLQTPHQHRQQNDPSSYQVSERRWTIGDVLHWTKDRFESASIPSARLDAEVLLAHVLSTDRLTLYLDYEKPLATDELAAFKQAVRRRLNHEPTAYIVGEREFWSLSFHVNGAVLIPRPETELLVECAIDEIQRLTDECTRAIVDVGTGSGAVAIALASECPGAQLVGVDLDPKALAVATENAAKHRVQVEWKQSDLLGCYSSERILGGVVANLPYIPTRDLISLQQDIIDWEPRKALDGGEDGLDFIRQLIGQAATRIVAGGFILLEIHPPQAEKVVHLLRESGFSTPRVHRDLTGSERCVAAYLACYSAGHLE